MKASRWMWCTHCNSNRLTHRSYRKAPPNEVAELLQADWHLCSKEEAAALEKVQRHRGSIRARRLEAK